MKRIGLPLPRPCSRTTRFCFLGFGPDESYVLGREARGFEPPLQRLGGRGGPGVAYRVDLDQLFQDVAGQLLLSRGRQGRAALAGDAPGEAEQPGARA